MRRCRASRGRRRGLSRVHSREQARQRREDVGVILLPSSVATASKRAYSRRSVHCSLWRTQPSPRRMTRISGSLHGPERGCPCGDRMPMIRCTTYCPGATSASATSPLQYASAGPRTSACRPGSIHGRMLVPVAGRLTLWPCRMSSTTWGRYCALSNFSVRTGELRCRGRDGRLPHQAGSANGRQERRRGLGKWCRRYPRRCAGPIS